MSELKEEKYETPFGERVKDRGWKFEHPVFDPMPETESSAEEDAAEDALDAAQASGFAKLEKLGLTVDEINALFGVEAPAVKDARKKERRGKRKPKGAAKGTLRSAFETMTGKNK